MTARCETLDGERPHVEQVVVCLVRVTGSSVLLGNGAIANDGVEAGEYAIVAAGAIVLESMALPPRSLLMGMPGQARSSTPGRHHEMVQQSAEASAEKTRRYLKQGNLGS